VDCETVNVTLVSVQDLGLMS